MTTVGLWKIEEDEDFFLNELPNFGSWKMEVDSFTSGKRRLQFLASRYLLQELAPDLPLADWRRDPKGKIYSERSNSRISISHSGHFAAVSLSTQPNGIDIQKIDHRMEKLSAKFIAPEEMDFIDQNHCIDCYHIIWSAKECIFKAYGKGSLDFKSHLRIDPFTVEANSGKTSGTLRKGKELKNYSIYFRKGKYTYLAVAVEN